MSWAGLSWVGCQSACPMIQYRRNVLMSFGHQCIWRVLQNLIYWDKKWRSIGYSSFYSPQTCHCLVRHRHMTISFPAMQQICSSVVFSTISIFTHLHPLFSTMHWQRIPLTLFFRKIWFIVTYLPYGQDMGYFAITGQVFLSPYRYVIHGYASILVCLILPMLSIRYQ